MKILKKKPVILLSGILCLGLIAAWAFYAQAAGRSTMKSIRISIGGKDITKSTYQIKKGKSKTFKITVLPAGGGEKISYTSSNKSVASVSSKGKITAKKAGTAKITVTAARNSRKKSTWTKIKVTGDGQGGHLQDQPESGNEQLPAVYMTRNINSSSMVKIYEALEWKPAGKAAVKLSTGEPPASNYLDPELIKEVVQSIDGTIVECNTVYGGSRSSTAMHRQVAKDHGFTKIADVDILDEDGSISIPVKGGTRLAEDFVGAHFTDYDSYLVLSHFKGHSMAGFGGAVKNISIGLGSKEGKSWIHSGGKSKKNPWGGEQDAFLESMAEAGKAVSDYLGKGERIVYINVMNRLSVDCDCDGTPAEPDMHDIGILASSDPVALDQACVDLVYDQKNGDGASLVRRIESRNGIHTLEHAEKIGLGNRKYTLVNIDR